MRELVIGAIVGAVVATGAVGQARAEELIDYGSAGGWDVLIDPTKNMGCLIQSEFEDGSFVRIGFDKAQGGGYIAAFNDDWGDIQEGKQYDIAFDLDGEKYTGVATAEFLDDTPGARIDFDNIEFFLDIMKKYTMALHTNAGEVMTISLDGTHDAMSMAMQCQSEVDAKR